MMKTKHNTNTLRIIYLQNPNFNSRFKLRASNMPYKLFSKNVPDIKLTVGSYSKSKCTVELDLVLYTIGTFCVVLIIYVVTRGWKGYTAPEEVDLGPVQVPFDRTPTNIIHY